MNWEAFGAIAEAVGAIAVFATLVYLARQVQHARNEQQAAAIRANRTERRQYFETARDSAYLPVIQSKVAAGDALTPEEERRLLMHNAATWSLIYSEWVQVRLGLPGEYATSSKANLAWVLALPGSQSWFEGFGKQLYPAEFVADVEHFRRNAPLFDEERLLGTAVVAEEDEG